MVQNVFISFERSLAFNKTLETHLNNRYIVCYITLEKGENKTKKIKSDTNEIVKGRH